MLSHYRLRLGCVVFVAIASCLPSSGWAQQTSADEDPQIALLRATFDAYKEQDGVKAFALGADEHGVAWGWGSDTATAEDATQQALYKCALQATNLGIEKPCALIAVGNTLLFEQDAQGADSEPAATTAPATGDRLGELLYDKQWIEGRLFQVGSSGDAQVWISLAGKSPDALLWVVNASNEPIDLRPVDVQLKVEKKGELVGVETFTADAYLKKQQRKQAAAAGLYALAANLNNQPQPTTSTVSGTTQGQAQATAWGPAGVGRATGSYYGTYQGVITTWPTAQDYADANARTAAQVASMTSSLRAGFNAMAAELLKPHTIMPGTYYGGVVHFHKAKGDNYQVAVSVGDREFLFSFHRAK